MGMGVGWIWKNSETEEEAAPGAGGAGPRNQGWRSPAEAVTTVRDQAPAGVWGILGALRAGLCQQGWEDG